MSIALLKVAPHVGAWIEITIGQIALAHRGYVAPHVGAWIEMTSGTCHCLQCVMSLPTWERGLKYVRIDAPILPHVAPHVGAWIEIHSC